MPFGLARFADLIVVYGLHCLAALAITLAFWWLAAIAERVSHRALASSHLDLTVAAFMSSLVRYAVLAVALVLILQVIGIQATSLVAVIGAASLAIGLALQGTLSNMAAGVMLLIFRPFHIGDGIEVAGKAGTVRSLNLFMTEIATGENVQVLIPNGQVWGAALTNLSAYPTRQVSVRFSVPVGRDLIPVEAELRRHLEADARISRSPPPGIVTADLTDTGLQMVASAWTATEHSGAVREDLLKRILAVTREIAAPASA
jgi:small conductance mechanosensitive channel